MSPVVASTRLSKERRDELCKALLELSNDPASVDALKVAGIERFVEPPPALYQEAQRIASAGR